MDPEEILEQIRSTVAEKKALGMYSIDALALDVVEMREPVEADQLDRARAAAAIHVEMQSVKSDKRVIGGLITRVKRLLARSSAQPLTSTARQQAAFNASTVAYLTALGREVAAQRERIEQLEQLAASRGGGGAAG